HRASSLDRHERAAGPVELVEVLGDPVALETLTRPAGEPLVDDGPPIVCLVRDAGDAEDVAAEGGHASPGIGRAQVDGSLREAIGGEVRRDVPAADARMLAVAPDPSPMQIARLGADPDAAQVDVVAQVDREPAPHARPTPAPRSPRLVAVAPRFEQLEAHALRLDPARPAARLLEMPLADVAPRLGADPRPGTALAVAAGGGGERLERHVHGDAPATALAAAGEVADRRLRVAGEPPRLHRRDPLVAHAGDSEIVVDHLVLRHGARDDRQVGPGEPHGETEVHSPLVRTDPKPGEEAGVGRRVVGVAGVGFAPRRVAVDGVSEIVALVEDGHPPYLLGLPARPQECSSAPDVGFWGWTWSTAPLPSAQKGDPDEDRHRHGDWRRPARHECGPRVR